MRAAFFGDTHGHLDLMYQHVQDWEREHGLVVDIVFQVGDFGVWPTIEGVDKATRKHSGDQDPRGDFPHYFSGDRLASHRTYFCRGNHEDQPYLLARENSVFLGGTNLCHNIHYLPDGSVTYFGELKVAALGGNYSEKTWKMRLPRTKLQGRRKDHISPEAWEYLTQWPYDFDILLTHEAPAGIGLEKTDLPKVKGRPEGGSVHIRELIEKKVTRYSFSGHWHHRLEATVGRSHHYSLHKTDPDVERNLSMVVIDLGQSSHSELANHL